MCNRYHDTLITNITISKVKLYILTVLMELETVTPVSIPPFNWLKNAKLYNKTGDKIPSSWLEENADAIVLLFTAKGVDRNGIVKKFYNIYESVKIVNVALEVIYIPFDETEHDYKESFEEQANWFTLGFADPLVPIVRFSYGITSIPHMTVIKPDCSIISSNGIMDVEEYGKNAVITWLTTPAAAKNHRRMSKDAPIYGSVWRYATTGEKKPITIKFSGSSGVTSTSQKK